MNTIITISPTIQSGAPVFTNTRVPVKNLFDYLKAGDSIETFLEAFPAVSREQVVALLQFSENVVTFSSTHDGKAAA